MNAEKPLMSSPPCRRPTAQRGFTLLEVMVALTITGLALGGLFGVIAGNKRLAWRSEQALLESTTVRSVINFAQLNDMRGDLPLPVDGQGLRIIEDLAVEMPGRRTRGSTQSLRRYEIVNAGGDVVASGTYWVELDLLE